MPFIFQNHTEQQFLSLRSEAASLAEGTLIPLLAHLFATILTHIA